MTSRPLDRRQFIGIGAAASVAAIGSSAFMGVGSADAAEKSHAYVPSVLGPRGSNGSSARFAGDPGQGKLYYGASVLNTAMLDQLESKAGRHLTVRRTYFQAGNIAGLLRRARDDHSVGRMPLVSIKPPSDWASVASGAYDSWLTSLIGGCQGTGEPVMLCIHHEPENDVRPSGGWRSQDWVAMQERAINIAARQAPLVTIVPILMCFTFETKRRNPADWMVPSAQLFGYDVYNPWSPGDGHAWTTFSQRAVHAQPWAKGRPIVIAEHGCQTDPHAPSEAGQWLIDAFNWCVVNNVVALSYFDSNRHSTHGSYVLDSVRTAAFVQNLREPAVVTLKA